MTEVISDIHYLRGIWQYMDHIGSKMQYRLKPSTGWEVHTPSLLKNDPADIASGARGLILFVDANRAD